MKINRLKFLLLVETLIVICLLVHIFLLNKSHSDINVYSFNRVNNPVLADIIRKFADNSVCNRRYKFITIEDISVNSDTVIYYITRTDCMQLVCNDLTFNILCEDIGGHKIIFRPKRYNEKYFKSIDTLMVSYLSKISEREGAVETLQGLIEENKLDTAYRSVIHGTGPKQPRIIVMFDHNGILISESEIELD